MLSLIVGRNRNRLQTEFWITGNSSNYK
jgi:hypothetical protein